MASFLFLWCSYYHAELREESEKREKTRSRKHKEERPSYSKATKFVRCLTLPSSHLLVQDNLIAFLSSVLLHPKSLTTMEIDPSLQGETPLHDEEVNVKKVQEGKRLSILDCAFSLIVLDCLSYKNFRVRLSILLI